MGMSGTVEGGTMLYSASTGASYKDTKGSTDSNLNKNEEAK